MIFLKASRKLCARLSAALCHGRNKQKTRHITGLTVEYLSVMLTLNLKNDIIIFVNALYRKKEDALQQGGKEKV